MKLKIGILLPRSDMFPAIGLDILNGLKLAFKSNKNSKELPTFIIENVGNAADDVLLKVTEKLLLQDEVDLIIGFCSISKLHELTGLFSAYKKPFIHIDLGGSILKKECISPFVLHHTLGLSQSAFAAGRYASKEIGKKVFVASSFYDGGYQLTDCFVRGLNNGGGEVVKHFVAPMDYKSETFERLITEIEQEKPDVIFALFSFKEGVKVFNVLANSEFNGKIPIVAIPLLTDETFNTVDYGIKKVSSVASWSFEDSNIEMVNFKKAYKNLYASQPNIMGLLGFETGTTVLHCFSSQNKVIPEITNAVRGIKIETPRGTLFYNSMNEAQTDSFKLRRFQFDNSKYTNPVVDIINNSFTEELYSEYENIPYTGWQNPYICT